MTRRPLPATTHSDDAHSDEARPGLHRVSTRRWQAGDCQQADDWVVEELPVALVYNGISHAVMMATPQALADLGLGFSLSEGIIQRPEELYDLELVPQPQGLELQMTIATSCFEALKQRRRNLVGPSGCGLCGAESLTQAIRPLPRLQPQSAISDGAVEQAVSQLDGQQPLRQATGACHAAAWCDRDGQIQLVREDVGRHNALDKLLGTLVRERRDLRQGFVLVSSRASYELIHKAAALGIGTLAAVSAPTSLALQLADEVGLQLLAFCRPGRHVSYPNPPHPTSAASGTCAAVTSRDATQGVSHEPD